MAAATAPNHPPTGHDPPPPPPSSSFSTTTPEEEDATSAAAAIFQVFDRRINLQTLPPSPSLYTLLRAWVQDDPQRQPLPASSSSSSSSHPKLPPPLPETALTLLKEGQAHIQEGRGGAPVNSLQHIPVETLLDTHVSFMRQVRTYGHASTHSFLPSTHPPTHSTHTYRCEKAGRRARPGATSATSIDWRCWVCPLTVGGWRKDLWRARRWAAAEEEEEEEEEEGRE